MPRVSIIMPAYNAAETIRDAIASALAQTECDIEVVVVDDMSKDATADHAKEMARRDCRVRVIRAGTNAGCAASRNRGIAVATGEWIGLLDADDGYHPQRLERLLALAARTGADLVADNLMAWPADRPEARAALLPESMLSKEMRLDIRTFIAGVMGRGSRVSYGFFQPLFRRAFLEQHRIRYPEIRFSEDLVLALECLLAGADWWVTPEPLYEYRMSPVSMTGSHPIAALDQLIAAERQLLQMPAAERDPAVAAALLRHIESVEKSKAWRLFAEAVKRRDALAAARLFGSRHLVHINKEGLRALWNAVAKRGPKPAEGWPRYFT
jgi:glycosyltransferase involved in cell wall biosynthesis